MTDALASILNELRPLIRMLSSTNDGEVVASVRGLNCILKAAEFDVDVLAESIGNRKLSDAEMRKLYDAGFEAGRRNADKEDSAFAMSGRTMNHRATTSLVNAQNISTDCATSAKNSLSTT